MSNPDSHVRRCRVLRVVDGDTLDLTIDMGWHLSMGCRLRLLGVDTPEKRPRRSVANRDEVMHAAYLAESFVADWVTNAGTDEWPLVMRSHQLDSFGRSLGDIAYNVDPITDWLSDALVGAGWATRA